MALMFLVPRHTAFSMYRRIRHNGIFSCACEIRLTSILLSLEILIYNYRHQELLHQRVSIIQCSTDSCLYASSSYRGGSHLHSSNEAFHSLHLLKTKIYHQTHCLFWYHICISKLVCWLCGFQMEKGKHFKTFKTTVYCKILLWKEERKKKGTHNVNRSYILLPTVLESLAMFKFSTSTG